MLQAHLVHAAWDHILSHQHEDIILVIFSGITSFFFCLPDIPISIHTMLLSDLKQIRHKQVNKQSLP